MQSSPPRPAAFTLFLGSICSALSSMGCSSNGWEPVRQVVETEGIRIELEGHLGPREIRLYSVWVHSEESAELRFTGGSFLLFEDLNDDSVYDPSVDRELIQVEEESPPHAPLVIGGLMCEYGGGVPCLDATIRVEGREDISDSFPIRVD